MSEHEVDKGRRRLLINLTTAVGAVGVVFAATPFVKSMLPSARARAAGAPVDVDISKIEPGQKITVKWRGKPVWVLRRTPEMLDSLKTDTGLLLDPKSDQPQQPSYAQNQWRSVKPDYFVVIGICTHLGCVPVDRFDVGSPSGLGDEWPGGFFCPCHGSKYDLAGRVFKGVPAPLNLEVPDYSYVNATRILIGKGPKKGAA